MKQLLQTLIVLFFSTASFAASSMCHEGELTAKGPANLAEYSFVNTDLPNIRPTARSFEISLVSGTTEKPISTQYEALCTGWPKEEIEQHGEISKCEKWCVTPAKYQSSDVDLKELVTSRLKCDACEKNPNGQDCEDVKILKDTGDEFKFKNGNALIQFSKDKNLLLFQTTNGEKDLEKPYLTLRRETEFFFKNKLEPKNPLAADSGLINVSKMTLQKSGVAHVITNKSVLTDVQRISDKKLDGQRNCATVELKPNDCLPGAIGLKLGSYTSYTCGNDKGRQAKGAIAKPADTKK